MPPKKKLDSSKMQINNAPDASDSENDQLDQKKKPPDKRGSVNMAHLANMFTVMCIV